LEVSVTASGTGTTTGYEVRVCIPAEANCQSDGTNFAPASSSDADDPDSEDELVRIITITDLTTMLPVQPTRALTRSPSVA
jgi:hypothetical protein